VIAVWLHTALINQQCARHNDDHQQQTHRNGDHSAARVSVHGADGQLGQHDPDEQRVPCAHVVRLAIDVGTAAETG
jgi:hypothetical protein